ncbi:hypothetical protein IV102_25500 [bacterium]|nr:hypothetical protein [bacterium]
MLPRLLTLLMLLAGVSYSQSRADMKAGDSLLPGSSLQSPNGQYQLVMQEDGNLVLYTRGGGVLWASQTSGQRGARGEFQADGNLVVYAQDGRPVWSSATSAQGGHRLCLQDDGNLVIYSSTRPLWSRTSGNLVVTTNGNPARQAENAPDSGNKTMSVLTGLAGIYLNYRQDQERQKAEQQRIATENQRRANELAAQRTIEAQKQQPLPAQQRPDGEAERIARESEALQQSTQLAAKRQEQAPIQKYGLADVAVVFGSGAAPAGFQKIEVDLNRKAKGAFIYLCCRYGLTENPICELTAVQVDPGQVPERPGFTFLRANLNDGTRGRPIHLGFRSSSTEPPIVGVNIVSEGDQKRALGNYWEHGFAHVGDRGYPHLVNLDLNAGAGGDYIYLRYKRDGD